ncbi:MAG: tRNA (N6-threonylcarbamoyladenosine(37)-N6)-methyltransferase TrmO [Candidatus Methanomethylicota archaeon]|uniref:tRNA (N6-threonylcarbamoyladenosine(37)-N6)-methyltransferase TrmO n=1 Tax=Thermoproteota archaeon TaxID=2056631 RepID=A0A497ERE9_9CREN|nr:MAG: tRNA (N6-threonylcarbamoyladenosine(37)-N6)-methyltransferase TrmO [Candidatus Verstraetearchaeota archaeon]RLE53355.1 MAG: tRNA (N6-threonylcarbamoyladenosine(37)-N6)-methyltransferase TrmO [Candidatus Verstraetearchaeota archaeon]
MVERIEFKPIGYVKTNVPDDEVKLRWRGVEADIVVYDEYIAGLKGIEEYSHIIVTYFFHKLTEEDRKVLVVKPRRLVRFGYKLEELPEVGVFACDSPSRPNLIGISVVKLLEVKGNVLKVSGLDAFDGTPVLDVKPYTPDKHVKEFKIAKWLEEAWRKIEGVQDR